MAAKYALLDAIGTVTNVVEWDGVTPYDPGAGLTIEVLPDGVWIGWTKNAGGTWSPPRNEADQ
ncbi:MAG TPA: hypothetical protein VGM17_02220 [Rhizomicrobium sp.]|jgi:hypothetical protein